MQRSRVRSFVWVLAMGAGVQIPGWAQTATGTISGRVTDSGGAVIVGATVDLTSIDRGTVSTVPTNDAGIFAFPSVPPGHYRMAAHSQGFKQGEVQDLVVEVGGRLEQNFQLEIGSVRESVTVETAEALVNMVSATVSSVVAGAPIQDLPLNGRDTLQLALTQPGVTPNSSTNGSGFSIAGGRSNSVSYFLDGGLNNSVANSVVVVDPNPDTVAEFRILTNNYSAEYGRSNGGIVNVVTKSGSNQVHGTLYDYLRNTDFNANNFFNQSGGASAFQPRPILIRNQFGGTMGGPLTLPKIVNGKDRFFWFFGYQGQRQAAATVNPQVTTFTPAEIAGDFSHASNGAPNAGVAQFLLSHPYYQPNPQLASQAIIDPNRIDPVAKAFIATEPLPTSPTGVLTPNGSATDNRDEFVAKTDFNITVNERFTFNMVRNHNPLLTPFSGANVPGYATFNKYDQYLGGLALTSVLTPALLNEAHFTANRFARVTGVPVKPLPIAQSLGMKITPDLSTGPPIVNFAVSGMNLGFPSSTPGQYFDTSYSWTDTLSWTRGRHNMKFGGLFNIIQNNGQFAFQTNGVLTFSGPTSAGGIGSGLDLADFLLGASDAFTQWPNAFSAIRGHQYGIFGQDEWKILPNLTLTFGLRYEYNTPKWDPQRRNYMMIYGDQSTRFPLSPEGLVYPCDPKAPCPGVVFPDKNNFAPRFGFAWDPFGKGRTSIRGGFGVFYDVLNGQDQQNQNGTTPFYSSTHLFYTPANMPAGTQATIISNPYGTAGVSNPFPSQPITASTDFSKFFPFGPGSVLIDPYIRNPYTYQWNLTLQQGLGGGMVLETGYVGSSSHKQIVYDDIDSFIRGTLLRPFNLQPGLQYPNAYSYFGNTDLGLGNSNYEGLVGSLTKRLGESRVGRTFFTLGYTYSKTLSDQDAYGSSISFYNPHQFYAPAAYDLRQRFVLSGGWELPFDRLWASGPKRLTGGWSLYPIFSTQTGLPVDFNSGLARNPSVPGPGGDGVPSLVRPYWTGGSQEMLDPRGVETFTVNGVKRTGHFYFDPSNFVLPACYSSKAPPGSGLAGACPAATYGNLQRNTFRGPGLTNFDLSLEKKTILTSERVQLLFRAEFFNVLNHTEFVAPTSQVSVRSALIGQITSTNPARIGQLALKLVF